MISVYDRYKQVCSATGLPLNTFRAAVKSTGISLGINLIFVSPPTALTAAGTAAVAAIIHGIASAVLVRQVGCSRGEWYEKLVGMGINIYVATQVMHPARHVHYLATAVLTAVNFFFSGEEKTPSSSFSYSLWSTQYTSSYLFLLI